MLYKTIIHRNDGSKLTLKFDNLEDAKQVAQKYHDKYAYDVAITETRTVWMRYTMQSEAKPEEN